MADAKRRKLAEESDALEIATSEGEGGGGDPSLTDLPNELVHNLCRFLTIKDTLSLRSVNRQFYITCSSSYLWTDVAIEDVYHKLDIHFIKTALRVCQPYVRSLSIVGRLPFSHYQLMIFNCKKIDTLCLYGIEITAAALHKVISLLPHLRHLTLTYYKVDKALAEESVFSSFSRINKLVIIGKIPLGLTLLKLWLKLKCFPPQFMIVVSNSTFPVKLDIPPISHSAHFLVYSRYRRPLNLPFYDRPIYSLQCDPTGQLHNTAATNNGLLVKLHTIVTPTAQSDMGQFGIVTQVPSLISSEQLPSYNQYGPSVTALDFKGVSAITAECFGQIVQETPNLEELSLKGCIITDVMDPYLAKLSEHCKKLRGLNIAHVRYSGERFEDKELVWYLLSKMKCLECLTVSCCAFTPAVDSPQSPGSEGTDEGGSGVSHVNRSTLAGYMKDMTQLHALCVDCHDCHDCRDDKCLLLLISNLSSLYYLKVRLKSGLGMKEVLQNCNQLSVLSINCRNLVPPVDPVLCNHLTHLHMRCSRYTDLSPEFVEALATNSKKLLKHFIYEGSVEESCMKDLVQSCSFKTCHMFCMSCPYRKKRMLSKSFRDLLSCEKKNFLCCSINFKNSFEELDTNFDRIHFFD